MKTLGVYKCVSISSPRCNLEQEDPGLLTGNSYETHFPASSGNTRQGWLVEFELLHVVIEPDLPPGLPGDVDAVGGGPRCPGPGCYIDTN